MTDLYDEKTRSALMSRIGTKDTTPELRVRRFLHERGLRFRLHRRDLAGSPDIVLPRHHAVVFVHGCFWHRHEGCRRTTMPKTRADFWATKFEANVRRDRRNVADLEATGWTVFVIWECETRTVASLEAALARLLVAARAGKADIKDGSPVLQSATGSEPVSDGR